MIVDVKETVWYSCWFDEDQEKKVRDYADENNLDLVEAVKELYANHDFDLYRESTESDFMTEEMLGLEE